MLKRPSCYTPGDLAYIEQQKPSCYTPGDLAYIEQQKPSCYNPGDLAYIKYHEKKAKLPYSDRLTLYMKS
jgi:hypothetical protein